MKSCTKKVRLAVVSGYEPFGDYKGNGSARIAQRLSGAVLADKLQVRTIVLRNTYDSHEILMQFVRDKRRELGLSREEPVVVVSGGLSSSIRALSLEAVGYNQINSKYADANGVLVSDSRPVVAGAPGAYRTSGDLVAVSFDLALEGVPSIISTDPGRFTCNSIAFGMWHLISSEKERIVYAFYHTGVGEGDVEGQLPPSKIYHPPNWLEKGVPSMIQTLARQTERMSTNGDWAYPIPIEDTKNMQTLYYTK